MEKLLFSLFTVSPMHVGAGSSVGVVDLPIIREHHTGYPVIPGSSLKGVLADLWRDQLKEDGSRMPQSELYKLFGSDDATDAGAGRLLLGEAKLLAFPVRSAKGGFAWLTCPLALGRFKRDWAAQLPEPDQLGESECFAPEKLKLDAEVVLEEYQLTCKGVVKPEIIEQLKKISTDELWQNELANHLVVVDDEMFRFYVENTCEIAQHVKIDPYKRTAKKGGFFCQENLPSETMFYTVIYDGKRMPDSELNAFGAFKDKLKANNWFIQVGADITTGLGWCRTTVCEAEQK